MVVGVFGDGRHDLARFEGRAARISLALTRSSLVESSSTSVTAPAESYSTVTLRRPLVVGNLVGAVVGKGGARIVGEFDHGQVAAGIVG